MKIVLRERGVSIAISPDDWQSLRLEETVGALARDGILRVERTSAAILLTPKNFVGEMRASNATLTILPKDEALYAAMMGLAVRFDGKDARHYDPASYSGEGDDLATPFVENLARSLEEGFPWHYLVREEATSQPRGKPNLARTITEFVAQGVLHKVVAKRSERRQIRALVNVVWAAYRCLPTIPGATRMLVAKSSLLIDALDPQDEFELSEIESSAQKLLLGEQSLSPAGQSLVIAALAILENDRTGGHAILFVPAGIARFINLERVWERAVAGLVAEAVRSPELSVAVHGLAPDSLKLFGRDGPTINPDVVVKSKADDIMLVADAKYKVLAESEASGIASDIYQLACYVGRTRAPTGLLVYLGSSDSTSRLGPTEVGSRIIVVRISAASLVLHSHRALAHLLPSMKTESALSTMPQQ